MPLLRPVITAPPAGGGGDDGGGDTGVITPPPVISVDRPSIYWTPPTGDVLFLTANGYQVLKGGRGLDMPPIVHYTDDAPSIDGSLHRGVRTLDREVMLPIHVEGSTRTEFLSRKRALLRSLDPKRGNGQPGRLTWAEPDGTLRNLDCWYESGLEGDYGDDLYSVRWQRFGLVLRALDPYWYGPDVMLAWSGSQSQTFFPLVHSSSNFVNLTPSQVLGATTVLNEGDVEAYPQWTISGPGTAVTLTNETTEQALSLATSLGGSSNQRVVDTRPGYSSVVDELSANRYPEINAGSSMWSLAPGLNSITVSVSGSSGTSRVSMTYRPRFEGV